MPSTTCCVRATSRPATRRCSTAGDISCSRRARAARRCARSTMPRGLPLASPRSSYTWPRHGPPTVLPVAPVRSSTRRWRSSPRRRWRAGSMHFARSLGYDRPMKRAWVLALLVVAACGKGPSGDQCKQLLTHVVDIEFKQAGAAATSDALKAEIAKQKTAVSEAKSKEFLDTCKKKMAKTRVECALAANDAESM